MVKVIAITCTGVLTLGVTGAFAGPIIYREVFTPDPAPVPVLSADDSTLKGDGSAPLSANALTGVWQVADGSYAGYRVDEKAGETQITVTGRTAEVRGSLTVDGHTLAAADLTVDLASLTTDSPQRDRYFREQAIDTENHPTAQFVLSEPVELGESPDPGEVLEHTLSGSLTINGVTETVRVEVQLRSDGLTTELAGSMPISFEDFEVEAPQVGLITIEPHGMLEFELITVRG